MVDAWKLQMSLVPDGYGGGLVVVGAPRGLLAALCCEERTGCISSSSAVWLQIYAVIAACKCLQVTVLAMPIAYVVSRQDLHQRAVGCMHGACALWAARPGWLLCWFIGQGRACAGLPGVSVMLCVMYAILYASLYVTRNVAG